MLSKLSLLLLLFLVIHSMAEENSSDSSDDDHHGKDENSEDDPIGTDSGNEKEKKEKNKDEKNKEKNNKEKEITYDDDADADISSNMLDQMFLGSPGKTTEKPAGAAGAEDTSEKTTIEPPQGVFGPNYWWNLGNAGSSVTKAPDTKEGEEEEVNNESKGSEGAPQGSHINPFFPYSRPVDVWDRLLVLVAFPICFFAVMLKAEMFR